MISKREFADVVSQINGRFEWFTNKISELEAEIKELQNPEPKTAPKKAPAKKKAATND